MIKRLAQPLAALAIASLAACTGGGTGGGSALPSGPPAPVYPTASSLLARPVGVGDSLTAGTQSNGTMGVSYTGNPLSALPGGLVPATQTNGFFALLYEQATGTSAATMAAPATSVLPLIAAPGNGSQVIPAVVAPGFAAMQSPCSAFNLSMYSLANLNSYRANPATLPLDVAVPGITAHEAINMIAPTSAAPPPAVGGNCPGYPTLPGDPTSGGLQTLLSAENSMFYPVLGSFNGQLGPNQPLTMLNAAVADRPTLATVWLGANDLLKYTFSYGQAPSDTPAQMTADLTTVINQLKAVGSKVVIANLPDILGLPQFTKGGAVFAGTMSAFLQKVGIPAPVANIIGANAAANIQTNTGVTINGYVTESGFLSAFSQCVAQFNGGAGTTNCNPVLDPAGAGSGRGSAYLPDAFAAQVQGLNTAYNQAIAAAAAATGTPLVDIHGTFVAIQNAGGVPVNPPKCCSLAFGGGILSFDGLHPSNTGYAIIANAFITQINTSFATSIPQVNVAAIYATDPYAPH